MKVFYPLVAFLLGAVTLAVVQQHYTQPENVSIVPPHFASEIVDPPTEEPTAEPTPEPTAEPEPETNYTDAPPVVQELDHRVDHLEVKEDQRTAEQVAADEAAANYARINAEHAADSEQAHKDSYDNSETAAAIAAANAKAEEEAKQKAEEEAWEKEQQLKHNREVECQSGDVDSCQ